MIGRTNAGSSGGGGSMSLAVVGGTARPTNTSENMVWVNTANEITDYVFSEAQPTSPVAGMVWIGIANSSSIAIVSPVGKDFVKLYLTSCRQYVGGKWSSVQAWIYQDGAWVKWSETFAAYITVTYPANSTCTCSFGGNPYYTDINTGSGEKTVTFIALSTGDWTVKSTANDDSGDTAEVVVTITAEGQAETIALAYGLYLFREGSGLGNGVEIVWGTENNTGNSISKDGIVWSTNDGIGNSVGFNPMVDCTKYTKLCFELKCNTRNGNSSNYNIIFGVGVNQITGANSVHDWVAQSAKVWNTERATYEVPLTGVNGSYYVKMGGYATTGTLYNVWLSEK